MLVVLIENQAVYYWGVAIDRTLRADPPVYVLDRSPREVEQRWQPYTRSFSALVFTQVWTWQPHTGPWLQVFGALRQEQVVRYQTMFMMLPTTYGGSAPVTYRFDRGVGEQRVAIWHDAGRAEQDCWWLWARSDAAMQSLVQGLWPDGAYPECETWDMTEAGVRGLRSLGFSIRN